MFTSTHGRAIGGDHSAPPDGGRIIGDATSAFRTVVTTTSLISMVSRTIPIDRWQRCGLGPSASDARTTDASASAGDAYVDRVEQDIGAGAGTGGHAR